MQDYHKLEVWKKASDLVDQVFPATQNFPPHGWDGNLAVQLRRSSVSVVLNIVEGCGRRGGPDFLKFLQTSMGSATEVEGAVELSRNRGYLDADKSAQLLSRVTEVKRMLTGLMKSLGGGWGPTEN